MNIITRLTGSPVRKSARLSVVLPRTFVINIYPIYTKQSIDKISRNMCCYGEHAKQEVSALFKRLFDQTCIPFFGPPLPFANYDEPLHLANYERQSLKLAQSMSTGEAV